ncbi:hypothetical protein LTR85_011924 [Meristemomyces frigidus]|nr:hypothetical protein LTR85_011924 [Meristemomyces frigidus]
MAKQASTKRELRPRKANGLAAAVVAHEAAAATKAAKSKTGAKAASPMKASPLKAVAGKASVAKAPAKKATPKATAGKAAKAKWFVWPPYTFVADIPPEHKQHWADLIGGTHPDYHPSQLHGSLPGTRPPQLMGEYRQGQAQQVVALKARYIGVSGGARAPPCAKTGVEKVRLRCVEPGWVGVHGRGGEVWVDPARFPGVGWDLPGLATRMVLNNLFLGFVMSNCLFSSAAGEGAFGKRDYSGDAEVDTKAA